MRKLILTLVGIALISIGLLYIMPQVTVSSDEIRPDQANPIQHTHLSPETSSPAKEPAPAPKVVPPTFTSGKPQELTSLPRKQKSPPRIYTGQPIANVIRNLALAPENWRDFNPNTLTLRLYNNTEVAFTRISHSTTTKHTTWVGHNTETSGRIVAVANEKTWNAEVNFSQGNSYRIMAGKKAVLTESSPTAFKCLSEPSTQKRSAATGLPGLLQFESRANLTDSDLENINISTVAALYDEDTETIVLQVIAAAEADTTAKEVIEANVLVSLDLANYYVLLSEIDNLEWELGGVEKIPTYQRGNDLSMNADLDILVRATTSAGAFARQFLTQVHADQGVLIVGGERSSAGLGETPGNYSVVSWDHYDYLSAIMAHELGHNFGCNHDRATEEAPPNNGLYAYGNTITADGESLGTIMSYGGNFLIPYYSNPNVSFEGVPTGVAADQPTAADNARQMRENAAIIANFRKHPDDPTITQQPQGRNATPGQSVSLSVVATGPNLRYQWYKDDAAITNANTDTLTLNSATTGDTGSYIVAVTNARTTATSAVANVNIRAATVSSGGASGGGGGGGGGGSPSIWFSSAITLLFFVRMIRHLHRA